MLPPSLPRFFYREAKVLIWDNSEEPSGREFPHETLTKWIIQPEDRAAQLFPEEKFSEGTKPR